MAVGQLAGSVIGGVVGGPAGVAIGAGAGGMIDSLISEAKAKNARPEDFDPRDLVMESMLKRTLAGYESGAEAEAALSEVRRQTSGIQQGIEDAGGSAQSITANLLRSGRMTGRNINQVLANINQQKLQTTGLLAEVMRGITQRKLELGMYDYATNLAQAKASEKTAMENINAGMAYAFSGDNALNEELAGENAGSFNELISNLTNIEETPIDGRTNLGITSTDILAAIVRGEELSPIQKTLLRTSV